jgi:hypothetical protein
MNSSKILRLFSAAFLTVGFSTMAYAQATRTWVSGTGDDANPCSRTAPCKTFAGAISKTAAAGEINVIDTGGFGAVTITKSISIIADHVEAGVLVSGTNGIVINAGVNDRIFLEGLDIEGLGTGLNGIDFLAGKELYVTRCQIRHFIQNGVNVASSTSGGHAFINDSFILFNGGTSGASTFGGVNVTGPNNIASLTNTSILSNLNFSVQANGAGTIVGLQTSVLNNTPVSISKLSGGKAVCVGPSNLIAGTGTCDSTITFK